ncbi:MAG: hypothetical protein JXX28_08185 [Deltaproteobacteria bacterium]|nr:hypothetical protein [Deltaproteobacteria bacterium]
MASAEISRLLGRLYNGLDSRTELDGSSRETLDDTLVDVLGQLMNLPAPDEETDTSRNPPRSIALGMVTGLFVQPHVGITVDDGCFTTSGPVLDLDAIGLDRPVVIPSTVLEQGTGLAAWEIDDLREEVDYRAGKTLKRARAVRWLWSRFGLPESSPVNLFRVLFPGAPGRMAGVDLFVRGAHLYACVDQDAQLATSSLFLGWAEDPEEQEFHPLHSFQASYLDRSLLSELGRAIGADHDELVELLDLAITVVPRAQLAAFLAHDLWRSRGSAPLTSLGESYHGPVEPCRDLAPGEVSVEGWMAVRNGQLAVRQLRRTFDSLALVRVEVMMKEVYAELLARLVWEQPSGGPEGEVSALLADLELYHLVPAMRRVFRPLLEWASAEATADHLVARFGVPRAEVITLMRQVRQSWERHLEQVWLSPPLEDKPRSVATILGLHLAATHASLRRLLARPPIGGIAHREVLLHFAAAYLSIAPVDRLWSAHHDAGGSRLGLDPIGRWFWSSWARLLALYELEPATTEPEDSYQGG